MLAGLIGQTRLPDEIVLIDDYSSDNVMQYCFDIISAQLPSIRIIKLYSAGSGPGWARRTGILAASSNYVAFLDSDDVWPAMHLERRAIKILDGHDFICGAYLYITTDQTRISQRKPKANRISLAYLLQHNPIGNSTVVCKRECLISAGGYSTLPKRNDYSTWIRLAKSRVSLYCDLDCQEVIIHRRRNSLSSSKLFLLAQNMAVFRENGYSLLACLLYSIANAFHYFKMDGLRFTH
jgi:teichuronic acid biosynthesis glycosyltransferase TuaG